METTGARVLIVDDDASSRRLLEVRLRALECDVVMATDGREALAAPAYGSIEAAVIAAFEPSALLKTYFEEHASDLVEGWLRESDPVATSSMLEGRVMTPLPEG